MKERMITKESPITNCHIEIKSSRHFVRLIESTSEAPDAFRFSQRHTGIYWQFYGRLFTKHEFRAAIFRFSGTLAMYSSELVNGTYQINKLIRPLWKVTQLQGKVRREFSPSRMFVSTVARRLRGARWRRHCSTESFPFLSAESFREIIESLPSLTRRLDKLNYRKWQFRIFFFLWQYW